MHGAFHAPYELRSRQPVINRFAASPRKNAAFAERKATNREVTRWRILRDPPMVDARRASTLLSRRKRGRQTAAERRRKERGGSSYEHESVQRAARWCENERPIQCAAVAGRPVESRPAWAVGGPEARRVRGRARPRLDNYHRRPRRGGVVPGRVAANVAKLVLFRVDPEWHHTAVASGLIRQLYRYCREQGYRTIVVEEGTMPGWALRAIGQHGFFFSRRLPGKGRQCWEYRVADIALAKAS